MSPKFTRHRFLKVLGGCAACLALAGSAGLVLQGRVTKVKSLQTPRAEPAAPPRP